MIAIILLFIAIFIILYYYISLPFKYWKNKNVPQPPVSLLFGNVGQVVLLQKSVSEIYGELYRKYSQLSYIGIYRLRTPCLLIRDPDVVKEVLVKNFHSFSDNELYTDEKLDPLFSKNPFVAKGHLWKESRNRLAPTFTAKRTKEMYPLMEAAAKNLLTYIKTHIVDCKHNVDVRELCGKYTMDVGISCALGIDGNSFTDVNSEYIKIMDILFASSSYFTKMKLFVIFNLPNLTKLYKMRFVQKEVDVYYRTLVNKALEYRNVNKVYRGDFLDNMMELKEKQGSNIFNDDDIVGNVFTFISEATEISSHVMSFTLYELALHPDIQANLKHEIDEMSEKFKGKFDYEAIQEMRYLDMIIKESMRKNTIVPLLKKLCTKSCIIESPDGTGRSITIESGTPVIIPVQSIHHDPKYFPNPDIYDPLRFSDDNQDSRPNYTYMPFGEGPRICLGTRYGITQIKVALVNLIAKFEVTINKKTVVPYRVDPHSMFLDAKDSLWFDFHER